MEEAKQSKITSVEKIKDPKKVEQGKKLAAMSKQAKEKKAAERSAQKMTDDEFQMSNVNPLAVVGVVGVVGAAVYYKYFYGVKSEAKKLEDVHNTPETKTLDSPKPKRKELDTLD